MKNRPAVRVNKELRNIFSKFSFWTAAKERWYKKLPWKPREKHSRDSMSGQIKYHVTLLNGLRSCVRKNFVFLAIFSWQILAQRFPCVFRGFSLKTSFYIEMEVSDDLECVHWLILHLVLHSHISNISKSVIFLTLNFKNVSFFKSTPKSLIFQFCELGMQNYV